MVRVVPFHCSARVPPLAVPPTAVQAHREAQDTLFSAPPPAGLGVGWIRQAVPFHRSARVTVVRDLLVVNPTVMHAEFCSRPIDAQVTQALVLQAHNPSAAAALWARIDHQIVNQAPWVPIYNPHSLVVLSTRVGNYQFDPYWSVLIDQLWVS
jgi:ABC-type transport system substrate-binding protein